MNENQNRARTRTPMQFPPEKRNHPVLVPLTQREHEAAARMADEAGLPVDALMRHALRHYQFVRSRIEKGETMTFSGDHLRAALFRGDELSPEDAALVAIGSFAII